MKAIGFPLSLTIGGLVGALLVFWAGESLGIGEHGGEQRPAQDTGWRGCLTFFVGVQRPGETHVHLANAGRENITAQLELIDEIGHKRAAESYSLGPHAKHVVIVGRPPFGTGIKVSSVSPDLRAHAELAFDDGTEPEPYRAGICA